MGKAKRIKKQRKLKACENGGSISDLMTENFQREIRNSEIWHQMVAEYGEEKAEQILKKCKADVKAGGI